MKTGKKNKLMVALLYGGVTDERIQHLIERIGYHTAILLCVGLLAAIFVKKLAFRQSIEHYLPEIVIVASGGIFALVQIVIFGMSIMDTRKVRKLNFTVLAAGGVFIAGLCYLGLFLKASALSSLQFLGPFIWAVPAVIAGLLVLIGWGIIRLMDRMAENKGRTLENTEDR